MTIRSFIAAVFALIVVLQPLTASAEIIDRIVARVNDQVITLYDVRQAAIPYVLQKGINPAILKDKSARGDLYKDVLEDLVDRKLLLQEAAKLELQIKDEELEQWLAFTRQQQGVTEDQFAEMIQQYGMRYAAYKEMVRENLLKIRMIKIKVGSQVNVTQNEVDQLYRERYGGDGAVEKFITVSHALFVPENDSPQAHKAARRRAIAAKRRVAKGEPFEQVAKDVSEGPTSEKGGFLGSFRRGELDPEFEKVAFDLEKGKVSDIVRTKFGYHLIRVTKIEERASPDIDQRKAEIRAELQQKTMEGLLEQYLQTLRTRAFVDIRY